MLNILFLVKSFLANEKQYKLWLVASEEELAAFKGRKPVTLPLKKKREKRKYTKRLKTSAVLAHISAMKKYFSTPKGIAAKKRAYEKYKANK